MNEYQPVWSNKGYIHVISITIKELVVTLFIKYKNVKGYETPNDAFITLQLLSSLLTRNSCSLLSKFKLLY